MKKALACMLAAMMLLAAAGCDSPAVVTPAPTAEPTPAPAKTELIVFAAASMTETLTQIGAMYEQANPGISVTFNFDSSGTLKTQIQEGADCDLFVSAGQKQMNQLDAADSDRNPDGLDLLLEGTRTDLLENRIALVAPKGNPKGVESFEQLAQMLAEGSVFMAMGNSDVPVGQYTSKILAWFGLSEEELAAAGCLTYGSNVKEVTTQVIEAAADCGVVYATDAFSAGLEILDTADGEMCGRVIYPAAVIKGSRNPGEAAAFLAYLKGTEAAAVFEAVGFSPAV